MRYVYVLPVDPDLNKHLLIEKNILKTIDKILISPSAEIQRIASDYPCETELRLSDSTYSITGSQNIDTLPLSQADLFQIQNIYSLLQEISGLNQMTYLLIIHEELLNYVISFFGNDFEKISDLYRFPLGEDILSNEKRIRLEERKDDAGKLLEELGFHTFDTNALLRDTSVLLSQSDILSLRKGRFYQKENVYACISGMIKENYTGIIVETADNIIDMMHHQTNSDPDLSVSCDLSDEAFKEMFLKYYGSL